MAKALYYDTNLKAKVLDVLEDHKDGTVTVGTGKTVLVAQARVVDAPKEGCVTLGDEPPKKAKAAADSDENKTKTVKSE